VIPGRVLNTGAAQRIYDSRLFPTLPSWISLRLLENRTFRAARVLLRYAAKHD